MCRQIDTIKNVHISHDLSVSTEFTKEFYIGFKPDEIIVKFLSCTIHEDNYGSYYLWSNLDDRNNIIASFSSQSHQTGQNSGVNIYPNTILVPDYVPNIITFRIYDTKTKAQANLFNGNNSAAELNIDISFIKYK